MDSLNLINSRKKEIISFKKIDKNKNKLPQFIIISLFILFISILKISAIETDIISYKIISMFNVSI